MKYENPWEGSPGVQTHVFDPSVYLQAYPKNLPSWIPQEQLAVAQMPGQILQNAAQQIGNLPQTISNARRQMLTNQITNDLLQQIQSGKGPQVETTIGPEGPTFKTIITPGMLATRGGTTSEQAATMKPKPAGTISDVSANQPDQTKEPAVQPDTSKPAPPPPPGKGAPDQQNVQPTAQADTFTPQIPTTPAGIIAAGGGPAALTAQAGPQAGTRTDIIPQAPPPDQGPITGVMQQVPSLSGLAATTPQQQLPYPPLRPQPATGQQIFDAYKTTISPDARTWNAEISPNGQPTGRIVVQHRVNPKTNQPVLPDQPIDRQWANQNLFDSQTRQAHPIIAGNVPMPPAPPTGANIGMPQVAAAALPLAAAGAAPLVNAPMAGGGGVIPINALGGGQPGIRPPIPMAPGAVNPALAGPGPGGAIVNPALAGNLPAQPIVNASAPLIPPRGPIIPPGPQIAQGGPPGAAAPAGPIAGGPPGVVPPVMPPSGGAVGGLAYNPLAPAPQAPQFNPQIPTTPQGIIAAGGGPQALMAQAAQQAGTRADVGAGRRPTAGPTPVVTPAPPGGTAMTTYPNRPQTPDHDAAGNSTPTPGTTEYWSQMIGAKNPKDFGLVTTNPNIQITGRGTGVPTVNGEISDSYSYIASDGKTYTVYVDPIVGGRDANGRAIVNPYSQYSMVKLSPFSEERMYFNGRNIVVQNQIAQSDRDTVDKLVIDQGVNPTPQNDTREQLEADYQEAMQRRLTTPLPPEMDKEARALQESYQLSNKLQSMMQMLTPKDRSEASVAWDKFVNEHADSIPDWLKGPLKLVGFDPDKSNQALSVVNEASRTYDQLVHGLSKLPNADERGIIDRLGKFTDHDFPNALNQMVHDSIIPDAGRLLEHATAGRYKVPEDLKNMTLAGQYAQNRPGGTVDHPLQIRSQGDINQLLPQSYFFDGAGNVIQKDARGNLRFIRPAATAVPR